MDNEEIAREHQLILDLAKSNKRRIDNLEEEQKEKELAMEMADSDEIDGMDEIEIGELQIFKYRER